MRVLLLVFILVGCASRPSCQEYCAGQDMRCVGIEDSGGSTTVPNLVTGKPVRVRQKPVYQCAP